MHASTHVPAQVARRDVLELLEDNYKELKLMSREGAENGGGNPADAPAVRANSLMGPADAAKRSYPLRCLFADAAQLCPKLEQLENRARQYLRLAAANDVTVDPEFDSDTIQIRPGLRLHERLENPRTQIGGRALHACSLQPLQKPVFVAISSEDENGHAVVYYGMLVLCFVAQYLGENRELCYVSIALHVCAL